MDEKKKGLRKLLKFDKKDIPWVFICIIIIFLTFAYKHDTAICREVIKDPCKYCGSYQQIVNPMGEDIPTEVIFNISFPDT